MPLAVYPTAPDLLQAAGWFARVYKYKYTGIMTEAA